MNLWLDPGVGRGFMSVANGETDDLRVYNLRERTLEKTLSLPASEGTGGSPGPAIDNTHHQMIWRCLSGPAAPSCNSATSVEVLNTQTLHDKQVTLPLGPGAAAAFTNGSFTNVNVLLNFVFDPRSNALFADAVSYNLTSGGTGQQWLEKYNPVTFALDWEVTLPQSSCNYEGPNGPAWAHDPTVITGSGYVAVYCLHDSQMKNLLTTDAGMNVVAYISTDSAWRPSRDAAGNPIVHVTPAIGDFMGILVDRTDNVLAMVSQDPSMGDGAYVFDVATGLLKGTVSTDTGDPNLDRDSPCEAGFSSTGRLYVQTMNGLFYSDVAHTPLPPGAEVSGIQDGIDCHGPAGFYTGSQIAVDPLTHAIYIADDAKSVYHVYRDTNPPTPTAVPIAPDVATQDIPEVPGMTASTFSGSSNAFGARYLSMGGPTRVVCAHLVTSSTACPIDSLVTPGDRDWYLAHSAGASLSNRGSSASAATLNFTDDATQHDLTSSGVYGSGGQPGVADSLSQGGLTWPATVYTCSDYGSRQQQHTGNSWAGQATAKCDLSGRVASSSAVGSATSLAAQLSVAIGSYASSASTNVDPAKGMLATAKADARNVVVGAVPGVELFSAREISTSAISEAHGRSGTAQSSFSRVIQGFASAEYSCDTKCDPNLVVKAIDDEFAQLNIVGYAFVTPADPGYYPAGSPRGYQSLVTKDRNVQVSDETANDDYTNTVSGLTIVEYQDAATQGRSRQVLQFAGVHTEAHYGIYALPQYTTAEVAAEAGCTSACGTSSLPPAQPGAEPSGISVQPAGAAVTASTNVGTELFGTSAEGWRFMRLALRYIGPLAALWFLFGSPLYLSSRRRSLARLG